jgi:hypothetical protein
MTDGLKENQSVCFQASQTNSLRYRNQHAKTPDCDDKRWQGA